MLGASAQSRLKANEQLLILHRFMGALKFDVAETAFSSAT